MKDNDSVDGPGSQEPEAHVVSPEEDVIINRVFSDVIVFEHSVRWQEVRVLRKRCEKQRMFRGTFGCYALMVISYPQADGSLPARATIRDDFDSVCVAVNPDFAEHLYKSAVRYVDKTEGEDR